MIQSRTRVLFGHRELILRREGSGGIYLQTKIVYDKRIKKNKQTYQIFRTWFWKSKLSKGTSIPYERILQSSLPFINFVANAGSLIGDRCDIPIQFQFEETHQKKVTFPRENLTAVGRRRVWLFMIHLLVTGAHACTRWIHHAHMTVSFPCANFTQYPFENWHLRSDIMGVEEDRITGTVVLMPYGVSCSSGCIMG